MTSNQEREPQKPTGIRGAASVFSDLAAMLGARVGSGLLSLGSVVMSTRILAPSSYGQIAFFTVLSILIFTITSAWTSTAVARYGREELEKTGSLVNVSWDRFLLAGPLLVLAAVVVVTLKLVGALPSDFSWVFVGMAIAYGTLWVYVEHIIYALESLGRMKLSAVALLGQQVVLVTALAVIFITGVTDSPEVIASMSLVTMTLSALVLSSLVWRAALWPPTFDRKLLRRIVLFSLPMIAFVFSQYVIKSVDLFVIGALKTSAAVGIYAVAYQAYSVLQALASAAPTVFTPLFVSLRVHDQEHVIKRYFERTVTQLTFAASVLAGLAAPLIFVLLPIVFGSGFEDAATPLAILMFPLVFFFVTNLMAPIIVLHERTRAVGLSNLVAAAINIGGDLLLLGPVGMGIEGPAIATSVSVGFLAVAYDRIARDCTASDARPQWLVIAPLAAGVAPALLLHGVTAVLVSIVSVGIVAALVIVFLRPFRADDAEMIANLDMPASLRRLALRGIALAAR